MIEAEGLEETGRAVADMKAEEDHGENVPSGNVPDAEALDHVVMNGSFFEIGAGMDDAGGEVEQVIDDEAEEDGTAPIHGTRGVSGDGVRFFGVAFGAGGIIFERQADAGPDVQQDGKQQDDANAPQEFGDAFEEAAIGVDFFRGFKELEIA